MEWVRGEVLGRGSFSTVNLAICRRKIAGDSPKIMAVKSCPVSKSAVLIKEREILELLSGCREIVSCYGDSISDEPDGKLYNIFLELVAGGDLSKFCRGRKLAAGELRRYAISILRGLRAVHAAGIVHCDIKPENILVDGGAAKIADFGLAHVAGEVAGGEEIRGTPLYISPEVLQKGEYSPKCDVWAFGCVVAEMAAGRPARRRRSGEDVAALLFRIGSGKELPEIPPEMTDEGRDFLGRCFEVDPRERWSVEMLLEHPFLVNGDGGGGGVAAEVSPRSVMEFPARCGECFVAGGESPEAGRLRSVVGETPEIEWEDSSGVLSGEGWITVRRAERIGLWS